MPPLLTIGIITVSSRKRYLVRLEQQLRGQIASLSDPTMVEIVINAKESALRGTKRREIVNDANGKYLAFIDDDDLVADSYLSRITGALIGDPGLQCIGFEGSLVHPSGAKERFFHSIRHTHWYTNSSGHYRNPNHLNPILTEICRVHPYKDMHSGEDHDFSMQLSASNALCREYYIEEEPMYLYFPGGWNAPS